MVDSATYICERDEVAILQTMGLKCQLLFLYGLAT